MTYENDKWQPLKTAPRGKLVRVRGPCGKCADAILDEHGQWMAQDYLLRGAISHIWFTPTEWMEIENPAPLAPEEEASAYLKLFDRVGDYLSHMGACDAVETNDGLTCRYDCEYCDMARAFQDAAGKPVPAENDERSIQRRHEQERE